MDMQAAQAALAYIREDMTIGLGSGKAIDYLIEFISMENYKNLKIVTNNMHTALLAQKRGLTIIPSWMVSRLNYTFDTLDWISEDATEGYKADTVVQDKILASMADRYIVIVPSSHLEKEITDGTPFQVEVAKEALGYVNARLTQLGARVAENSAEGRAPKVTSNGNFVLSAAISWKGSLTELDAVLKNIPGVFATSLFTGLNVLAIVYDNDTIRTIG